MGEIAIAATLSHAPGITGFRQGAGEQADRYYAGMAKLRHAFEAAKPDLILEIYDDHFTNFYVDNMPAICVGVGANHFGPVEEESFLKIPKSNVPGSPDLAWCLVREGFNAGFDLAISHKLLLDHGAMVPLYLIAPAMNIPVVPIVVNTVIEPMPSPARVYALGQLIRNVIAGRPKGERIALVGTGGLSHWVGTPEMGRIDREFDQWFLKTAEKGKGKELAALTPHELGMRGNGAHELRNWIAVYGAIGDLKGEIVAYEAPIPWFCGCGAIIYRM
jgi:Catalytic LigB subunit of aromatic ring-opening dioxygenase